MSGQALQAELTNLAQEAKRKNPELRTAAERSLQELRSLPSTSEQQLAADLSRRPNFIDPFLLACSTKNPKFASSAANCLQRLVILRGLPKSRLKDVLDAFNACTSLSLDVQLKVLQALPTLAQSYAEDLKGEKLAGALQVCAALQNVKTPTVSGVATATLQQLVVSVFEKVSIEDARHPNSPVVAEVPGEQGPVPLKEAAHDAYRVFLDIALSIEGRRPKFVPFSQLSPVSGLELIGACMETHSRVFLKHIEQTNVVRSIVMPFLIRVISERQSFAVTLRAIRVASLVIRRHLDAMPEECEMLLGLLTYMLDPEAAAGWKRVLCMEVFRMIYTEPGLAIQIYRQYDSSEGKKNIIRDNIATFVRLSTEKPSIIGLGQQSSIPTGPANQNESATDLAIAEAEGGVAGVIGVGLGVSGSSVPGISFQWSVPKAQCIDQLDKTEPPTLPETYVYSLVLECLNGLSENLAKVVLPLSVQHVSSRTQLSESADEETPTRGEQSPEPESARTRRDRSQSYRSRTVPVNPLQLEASSAIGNVKAIANLVDECWPALLATYSTFLNAALDNAYYRALIRSYQRFVQVSGLLRLITARDAFLTTLGKSAVPPNIVGANMPSTMSPISETPSGVYSHTKGLLSVDSFTTQASNSDRRPRSSANEQTKPTLSTRNLLCLRALLNVAIAIGPTLESAFTIVFETLQQAGSVLNTMNASHFAPDAKSPSGIGSEVAAVEAAALRLFESTADYPNDAFMHCLTTLCTLIDGRSKNAPPPGSQPDHTSPLASPRMSFSGRRLSSLPGLSPDFVLSSQDYLFILTRLGELADLNTARFATYDATDSGWKVLVECLVSLAINASIPADARRLAADILSRCGVSIAVASTSDDVEDAGQAQKMVLSSLRLLIHRMYSQNDELTNADVEIHGKALDAVRSILEKCGDALSAGWDTILAILSSVFDDEDDEGDHVAVPDQPEDSWLHISSQVVAPYLSRSAFGIMQLVCSDFLLLLPQACFTPLTEILYRFASQEADLNTSLTTVSLFWDISDFLVKQGSVLGLNDYATKYPETRLTHAQILTRSDQSRPAQWMLALYRIADVVSDKRAEVRNSAFQTLLRIFNNHADGLTTSSWELCFETLLMKILDEDVSRQLAARDGSESAEELAAMNGTSKTLLEETGILIADNLTAISQSKQFDRLWSELLNLVQKYLSSSSAIVIAALFTAMTTLWRVLSAGDQHWKPMIKEGALLCSAGIPNVKGQAAEQEAYLAYTDCIAELCRLNRTSSSSDDLKVTALDLFECVCASTNTSSGMDVHSMTPLQSRVLECLKMLRTDVDGIASTLIKIASTFVRLPFDDPSHPKPKTDLTFVALSKASMDWLVELVATHITKEDVLLTNSVARALESLIIPMKRKYTWKQNGKGPAPWQKATPAALAIIKPALTQMHTLGVPKDTQRRVWRAIIATAHMIMHAELPTENSPPPLGLMETDESADCTSLKRLRAMIIPGLGNAILPDQLRSAYVYSLFQASIIHEPEHGDVPQSSETPPLRDLLETRLGRVHDPTPTPREAIAYLCLDEMLSLATGEPTATASAPNNDGNNGTATTMLKTEREERVRLARAAAPWAVLRLALPLRAYIADQPLRGTMPTPLSQIEELTYCLSKMRSLVCVSDALLSEEEYQKRFKRRGMSGGETGPNGAMENKKGGVEDDGGVRMRREQMMHLKFLFPLVVRALTVAGDRVHGSAKILVELQAVLEVAGRGL
ncbi:hypothetical protein AAFC00_005549 [Neodothiora populina]|uniref:Endosomal peripheral membrane protein n=1 Tax=Neodothiora populina TaxID=2781224 RepID=A0ABR3PMC9_9PEZI